MSIGSLIVDCFLLTQKRLDMGLPFDELSILDAPIHPSRNQNNLANVVNKFTAASLSVPILHQVLNLLEFSKIKLFLFSQTPLFKLVAV